VDAESDHRGRPLHPPSVDLAIAALAARQDGVVEHGQLLAAGLSSKAIRSRVSAGRLHVLYRGVYAVGHRAVGVDGRRWAAVFACGPEALLSHRSAIDAYGLRRTAQSRHDVLTPARGRRSPKGIRLHTTRHLHPDDITTLRGIPVTSVARSLVDFAATATAHEVERAVHQAEVRRLLDVRKIEEALSRAAGRKGTRHLTAAISTNSPGTTHPGLEDDFLAFCRHHGLETPAFNAWVSTSIGELEVDALWHSERLIVEVDDLTTHLTRHAFHRDRERDLALADLGYRVVRLTRRQIRDNATAHTLSRLLDPG
jgi:very-short-patch-repair endonuclease